MNILGYLTLLSVFTWSLFSNHTLLGIYLLILGLYTVIYYIKAYFNPNSVRRKI